MNVDQAKIDTLMRMDVVELLNLKTQVLMGFLKLKTTK